MAHDKIFGICESKCLVETLPKNKIVSKDEFTTWYNQHCCKTFCKRMTTTDNENEVIATSDYMIQISRLTKTMHIIGQCKFNKDTITDNADSITTFVHGITHLANFKVDDNDISTDFEGFGSLYQTELNGNKTGVCAVPNSMVVPCDVIINISGYGIDRLSAFALAYPEHTTTDYPSRIILNNKSFIDAYVTKHSKILQLEDFNDFAGVGIVSNTRTLLDNIQAVQFNVTLPITCNSSDV